MMNGIYEQQFKLTMMIYKGEINDDINDIKCLQTIIMDVKAKNNKQNNFNFSGILNDLANADESILKENILQQEDNKLIRKIKKIIYNTDIPSEKRLFTGEFAGDFAIRYTACALSKQREKNRI